MNVFRSEDHIDDILNLWARGLTAPAIAEELGDPVTVDRVTDGIKRARRAGDPRATTRRQGGHHPPSTVWTPEMCARVTDLVAGGYSTREIARTVVLTPQQVAGFISRRGLKLARAATGGRGKKSYPADPNKKPRQLFNVSYRRRGFVQPKSVNLDGAKPIRSIFDGKHEGIARPAEQVLIKSLTDEMCRFPIGDPRASDFTFCGAQRRLGRSYCASHMRIAYTARSEAA